MSKTAKSKICNKNNEFKLSVQVPECDTQLCLPECTMKLRTSSEPTKVGSESADATTDSKAVIRKKRKRKHKNVHLKAVTKKSHLEINALDKSPSIQKSSKEKKQEACNEHLKYKYSVEKAVVNDQNCNGTVDSVSLHPKLKPWPCRSSESKDSSEVTVKENKLNDCPQVKKSFPSHRCFDFSIGSTVRACCLSCKNGFWVSADPRIQSLVGHKPVNHRAAQVECPEATLTPTVPAPSTSNESSGHSELPGFYFDPEKKRYFKIVSSSNNCMSNAVTRERITFDTNEKLRQEELKSLTSTGHLKDPKHQTTVGKMANVLTLFDRIKRGIVKQEASTYQLRRLCITKLRPHTGKGNRFLDSAGAIIQKMRINAKENQLLICHSVHVETSINLMKISSFKSVPSGPGNKDDRCFILDLQEECNNIFNSKLHHVSDMCFATPDSASAVIYCANDHLLNTSSILVFRRIVKSPPYPSQSELLIANQTKSYLMCCASTSDFFAVGTERNVFLCNYAKRNLITQLHTENAAIHALTFANTSSRVLFCAAKNGRILMYDELSSKRKPVAYLAQPEGFSCDLYLTRDDRYLLSAKYNGQHIEKWDLRQGRVVLDYPGHISDCVRTPLIVDQHEEFLSAVGSDSYTRIWDIRTGELMKVLPPPLPATKENIPSVCFVDLYGESRNNYPGLLLGMSDELHFYSL